MSVFLLILITLFFLNYLRIRLYPRYKHQARPFGITSCYGENMRCKFCGKLNWTWKEGGYPCTSDESVVCIKSNVKMKFLERLFTSVDCRDNEYIDSKRGIEVSDE